MTAGEPFDQAVEALASAGTEQLRGDTAGLHIRGITVRAVNVPMPQPHRTASGTIEASPLVLTDLFADVSIMALGLVAARELSDRDPRRTLALMTASFGLGQIIGPAFAGTMHDLSGSFLWPSLAAAGALLLAALLVLTVRPVMTGN